MTEETIAEEKLRRGELRRIGRSTTENLRRLLGEGD